MNRDSHTVKRGTLKYTAKDDDSVRLRSGSAGSQNSRANTIFSFNSISHPFADSNRNTKTVRSHA